MTLEGIDGLDRYILHALWNDARNASSKAIAEAMDVSSSTVRKRIQRLEREGILAGYRAEVDYARAGYPLCVQVVCTAAVPERRRLADGALSVPGVVSVREIAAGTDNVLVTVVARDENDLTRIGGALTDLGLVLTQEQLVHDERFAPFPETGESGESATFRKLRHPEADTVPRDRRP